MRYTTRTEAIQAEIIDPIEASDAVSDAAAEYDIDAIADEVLGSYRQWFACQVTPEEFWDVVARYARKTVLTKVEFSITETVTRTGTAYIDLADVCADPEVGSTPSDLTTGDMGEYVAINLDSSELQITDYMVEDRTARAWRAHTVDGA